MASAWAQSKVGTFNISNPRGEIRLDVLYKLPQNRHNYWVLYLGGNTSIQEKAIEVSMLDRHLIFSFVLLVQRTSTIITDDLYLCIETVSTATTYL